MNLYIEKFAEGKIPQVLHAESDLKLVDELIRNYQFNEALAVIWESIGWCNKLIDDGKPWEMFKHDPEGTHHLLSRLTAQLLMINHKVAPFMPDTAEKIRVAFESGEDIKKIEPLFPRVQS